MTNGLSAVAAAGNKQPIRRMPYSSTRSRIRPSARSTTNELKTRTSDSVNAKAVVSKATARPPVTSRSDVSSCSGVTLTMAMVIPMTVPRKPRMGTAHVIVRTSA